MESEASAEQKSSGGLDFSLMARVAERIRERFTVFHGPDLDILEMYTAWNSTQELARTIRKNIMESETNAEQKSSGGLDFSLVARVAEDLENALKLSMAQYACRRRAS